MTNYISSAVREQQNVVAIHDVTIDNASNAAQTGQEAHSLQKIAENLQRSIGQFRV